MTKKPSDLPLSLYIHIPWCIKKCPYCDFNSHQAQGLLAELAYVHALIEDLQQDIPKVSNRSLHSIFIGGGTPSLLSGHAYQQLLTSIKQILPWKDGIEITIEANPGSADQQNFAAYREAGINRISLGIQSFQDDKLRSLGRVHNSHHAAIAINAAKQAGFDNINLDLMFGLPQQTTEDASYDINTAISFKPNHLSWYQLTLEPNTVFYKTPPTLPNEGELWEIEQQGNSLITQHYQQYEISAYSKPDCHSQHNLNYWLFGDYLGIGAGAHSKITNLADGSVTRLQKVRQPQDYLNPHKAFIAKQWQLTDTDLSFEFMLNCLRLHQPIPWELFTATTGLSQHSITGALHRAQSKNLLVINELNFQTTPLGRRYLNELQQMFL